MSWSIRYIRISPYENELDKLNGRWLCLSVEINSPAFLISGSNLSRLEVAWEDVTFLSTARERVLPTTWGYIVRNYSQTMLEMNVNY